MLSGLRGLTFRNQYRLVRTVTGNLPSITLLHLSSSLFGGTFRSTVPCRSYMSQSYDPITKSECPEGKTVIIEGSASMLYDTSEAVFYNKVQVLNRDLSIRVITHFAETIMKERKEKIIKKQEVNEQSVSSILHLYLIK